MEKPQAAWGGGQADLDCQKIYAVYLTKSIFFFGSTFSPNRSLRVEGFLLALYLISPVFRVWPLLLHNDLVATWYLSLGT